MRHTNDNYKAHRQLLIAKFGGHCMVCGTQQELEFHIIGNGSGHAVGGWQHLEYIENCLVEKKKSIKLLCRSCHAMQHRKEELDR